MAGGFQNVALAFAPRTSVLRIAIVSRIPMASVPDIALERFRIVWVQQLRRFAVLTSQERSGTIQDRQDAAVRLTGGAGFPRIAFWHAAGSSNSCLPAGHFPQWK
eukprot:4859885-Pyramimonas_sp.AAC.1